MTGTQQADVTGGSGHRMQVDRVTSTPPRVLVVVANPATNQYGSPVGFWAAELTHPYYELVALLEDTPAIRSIDPASYDAVMVAGGQAPMSAYRDDVALQALIRAFSEAEKPIAVYCHGVAALVDLTLSDGSYLVRHRTVTGFANLEEEYGNRAAGVEISPWRIEDALRERGANYVSASLFKPFVIRDGRLVTGQQQYSGRKVAQVVIEMLGV
jgi:putative intracellular protease/amidase